MAYLRLEGASGDYASAADSAATSITGDIDVRVRVALDDWIPSANNVLICKDENAPLRSYRLTVAATSGRLFFYWSTDGTALVNQSTAAGPGFTDGTTHWVRVTLDVDNGSSQHVVTFYSADGSLENPAPGDWSQLEQDTVAGTTSIADTDAAVMVGANGPSGFFQNATGDFYRAQVYDGIAGTLVFDADPSDPATWNCPAKDSFTEKANGATVTLQGDAELVGDCPASGNRMGGTGAIRRSPVGR